MSFAPRTWVVGEVVTAAQLNTEVRDQFNSLFGAWTAYTPIWSAATTAPVLGNGTLIGRYLKIGRTVNCHIDLTAGSTTTYGSGGWAFSVPAAAAAAGTGSRVGDAHALGSGTSNRYGGQNILSPAATDTIPFFPDSTLVPVTRLTGATSTVPFTWASGYQLRMSFTYEAAS